MSAGRILTIDDDEVIRHLLTDILSAYGFSVSTACSVETALSQLRQEPFDIVISDIHIPGLSGFDLLQTVRSENIHVGVILLTGFDIEAARELARLRRADGFLAKPFRIDDMLALIRDLMQNRKTSSGSPVASPEATPQ